MVTHLLSKLPLHRYISIMGDVVFPPLCRGYIQCISSSSKSLGQYILSDSSLRLLLRASPQFQMVIWTSESCITKRRTYTTTVLGKGESAKCHNKSLCRRCNAVRRDTAYQVLQHSSVSWSWKKTEKTSNVKYSNYVWKLLFYRFEIYSL